MRLTRNSLDLVDPFFNHRSFSNGSSAIHGQLETSPLFGMSKRINIVHNAKSLFNHFERWYVIGILFSEKDRAAQMKRILSYAINIAYRRAPLRGMIATPTGCAIFYFSSFMCPFLHSCLCVIGKLIIDRFSQDVKINRRSARHLCSSVPIFARHKCANFECKTLFFLFFSFLSLQCLLRTASIQNRAKKI